MVSSVSSAIDFLELVLRMSVRDVPRMDFSAEVLSGISCVEEERFSVLEPSVRVGTFGAFA